MTGIPGWFRLYIFDDARGGLQHRLGPQRVGHGGRPAFEQLQNLRAGIGLGDQIGTGRLH